MFETSKDILYVVISFCVLWTTVFLCWVFFQLARVLKNANQIIEEFRLRLQTLTDAIDHVRNRVETISNLMTLAGSGVTGLMKKVVTSKAKEWMNKGSTDFNHAAKDAVDRAVAATAKRMKKTAKAVRR